MSSQDLSSLDVLIGDWRLLMTNAWFLDSMDTEVEGRSNFSWLDDGFVRMTFEVGGPPNAVGIMGMSGPTGTYTMLYHDERGVSRVYDMTFGNGLWIMIRQDPDFHQRFRATVDVERIEAVWEASEDEGRTWRKDFDLVYDRIHPATQPRDNNDGSVSDD